MSEWKDANKEDPKECRMILVEKLLNGECMKVVGYYQDFDFCCGEYDEILAWKYI